MDKIYIFVGGYAVQNNGDAGIGICFYTNPESEPFYEEAYHVGVETQNSAVYKAIIRGLEKAREWNFKNIILYSDNRLVVSQLSRNMTARAQNIVPLNEEVKETFELFDNCKINYVKSNDNQRPRELARAAALATPDMITAQALQFEVGPGITGLILAFTPSLMVVQFKYKKGSTIAAHSHYHDQASYLVKGALKYVVAEKDIIMRRGAALVVSSNALHQSEALEDTTEIVTYYPMRADLLSLSQ